MRVLARAGIVVVLTVVGFGAASVTGDGVAHADHCPRVKLCEHDRSPGGADDGWDSKHPVWGPPYCALDDNDKDEQTVNPFPFHESQHHGYWRTEDGGLRSDSGTGTDVGPIKTHQSVTHWCAATEGGPPGIKVETFWMPLVNPDTIIFNRELLAQVEAELRPAKIKWLNMDVDHRWLWVRVEHFFRIGTTPKIFVEDWAGDEVTGRAHAWIRAYPVEFKISVPGVEGTDGVSSCDLDLAKSEGGCSIRFTHASSIDPSGEFTLKTELVYEVESNSGKYAGIRFSREGTETVTVAEAMAVSIQADD